MERLNQIFSVDESSPFKKWTIYPFCQAKFNVFGVYSGDLDIYITPSCHYLGRVNNIYPSLVLCLSTNWLVTDRGFELCRYYVYSLPSHSKIEIFKIYLNPSHLLLSH